MSTDYYANRILSRESFTLRVKVVTLYGDFAGSLPRPHNPAHFFTMLAEMSPAFDAHVQTDIYDEGPELARHFIRQVRCVEMRNLFRPMKYGFLYARDGQVSHADEVPYGVYDVTFFEELAPRPSDEFEEDAEEGSEPGAGELTMAAVLDGLPAGYVASCATDSSMGVLLPAADRERVEALVTAEALAAALRPGATVTPELVDACAEALCGYLPEETRDAISALLLRHVPVGEARHAAALARASSQDVSAERLLARTLSPEGHAALLTGWAYEAQHTATRNRICEIDDPPDLPRLCESAAGIGLSPRVEGWVLDNLRDRLREPLRDAERVALLFALHRHGAAEGAPFLEALLAHPWAEPALRRAWLWMLAGLSDEQAPAATALLAELLRDLAAAPDAAELRQDLRFLLLRRPEWRAQIGAALAR